MVIQTKIKFESHDQRMKMDCHKNMLEALLDDDIETAEKYSRIDDEMSGWFQKYRNMSKRDLLQNRIYQNGYLPDEEFDEKLQDILQDIDDGKIEI